MPDKKNDLFDFMKTATRNMADEYDRIQKRATEDPGTAGDQGEENWAELFRKWLPPTYHVVTKGRLLNHQGVAGPQIDVIILIPEYPEHLRNTKLYLAGGVVAAFECKVTLKVEHIRTAVESACSISRLLPQRTGTPYKELVSPIIYGLLAHSHVWTGDLSKPIDNVTRALTETTDAFVQHPREMLDFLCISNLGTWAASKMFIRPPGVDGSGAPVFGPDYTACTSHTAFLADEKKDFTPIGTLISLLFERLAWENHSIRNLADYFRASGLWGSGYGTMKFWDPKILSADLRSQATPERVIIKDAGMNGKCQSAKVAYLTFPSPLIPRGAASLLAPSWRVLRAVG